MKIGPISNRTKLNLNSFKKTIIDSGEIEGDDALFKRYFWEEVIGKSLNVLMYY